MVELRKGIYKVRFLAGPLTNRLYWPAQYTLKTECRPLGTIHFFHLDTQVCCSLMLYTGLLHTFTSLPIPWGHFEFVVWKFHIKVLCLNTQSAGKRSINFSVKSHLFFAQECCHLEYIKEVTWPGKGLFRASKRIRGPLSVLVLGQHTSEIV